MSGLFVSCSTESTPVYQLTTQVHPEAAGAVQPAGGEFDEGSKIEITAVPQDHWVFAGWQGDHSNSKNPDSLIISQDLSVTAMFEKRQYPLTIEIDGEGVVEEELLPAKSTDYPHGSTVQITAKPDDGWFFSDWSGHLNSTENPAMVEVNGEAAITAHFKRHEFQMDIHTEGAGSVLPQLVSGTETENGYLFDSVVELSAEPESGWAFVKWEGDLDGSTNPEQITIDSDKQIQAVFEEQSFTLQTEVDGNGTIQINPEKNHYSFNEEVTLEAVADRSWNFTGWSGDLAGSQNPITIPMDSDKQITAEFEELCLDPEECVSIRYYASVVVGSYVFDSHLSIQNHLPDSIYLTRIRIRRGDGGFAADSEGIDEWIEPGNGLSFSATYLPQPTTDQFQNFTAQFFIEYEGTSYTLSQKGTISSFKSESVIPDPENHQPENPGEIIRIEM